MNLANLVNILILPLQVLFALGALWVQCVLLDNLPKNAFEEQRVHMRWAMVFLILVLVATGVFIYMVPSMVGTVQKLHEVGLLNG